MQWLHYANLYKLSCTPNRGGGAEMSRKSDPENMMIMPSNGRNNRNDRNGRDQQEDMILDYVVRYDDGFRNSIHIYGVDNNSSTIFGSITRLAVSIGVDVQFINMMEISPMLALLSEMSGIDAAIARCGINLGTQVNGRSYENQLGDNPDWEYELQMDAKEQDMNCVKIAWKSELDAALHQHAKNYSLQFQELGDQMMGLYNQFMKEHPAYQLGKTFPNSNMH
jgi:hypothetical protein